MQNGFSRIFSLKALLLIAALFVVGFAQAESWLWWLVDTEGKKYTTGEDMLFDYAKVRAVNGDDSVYLNVASVDGGAVDPERPDIFVPEFNPDYYLDAYAVMPTDGTYLQAGSQYIIELYYHGVLSAQSTTTYENIMNNIVSSGNPTAGTAFAPTEFTSVPEPSGGLLTLLGVALLALKRKNSKETT